MLPSWCLTALCASAVATASAAGDIPFEAYNLEDNGLRVILSEDHTLPVVAVNVWYHAGPINEVKGRSGFAHLFEHLMFQGSKHVGDDQHFKLLSSRGATDVNGTTSFERTNYIETVPANELELALWLEADRMGFLLDDLTQGKLDTQRQVVMNEKRQSVDNAPYGPSHERLVQLLFGPEHPFYGAVIGSMQDLEAATLDDVRDFYSRYYAPANATLTLVGDFDAARARQLIHTYFASLPARERPKDPKVTTASITQERRATLTEPVNLPQISMAWLTPPVFEAGDADLDVLANILAGGKSSRLYRRLVHERPLAQQVWAQQDSTALVSIFHAGVTARPDSDLAQLEREVLAAIGELAATPPSQDEVDRVRNGLLTQLISGMQDVGGFSGRAEILNRYQQLAGDPGFLARDIERYRKVSPQSVQAAAKSALPARGRVIVTTLPTAVAPTPDQGRPHALR